MNPQKIVILRHGEKTTDATDEHLSLAGYQRAAALAPMLDTDYPGIVAIYAAGIAAGSTSYRPLETITPLAERVGVTPIINYPKDGWQGMVTENQKAQAYTQGIVVICWVHDEIPDIAQALGAPKTKWPSGRYDVLWILDFTSGKLQFLQEPQLLMYGDQALAAPTSA